MWTLLKVAGLALFLTGCGRQIQTVETPYLTCFKEGFLNVARTLPEYQNRKLFHTSLTTIGGEKGIYYCMLNAKEKDV